MDSFGMFARKHMKNFPYLSGGGVDIDGGADFFPGEFGCFGHCVKKKFTVVV